jgi:hypothetical protein
MALTKIKTGSVSDSITLTTPTVNGGTHTSFTSTGIDDNATSTALTIDASENLGVGSAPDAWASGYTAIDVGSAGSLWATKAGANLTAISDNSFFDGSSYVAKNTGLGSMYFQNLGSHYWRNFASVSAGANQTATDRMQLNAAGNLIIGGGITLGNGQTYAAANTLDDYEEGGFSPAIVGGTQTITAIQQARYTKIGRSVTLNVYCTQSTVTDSTSLALNGLPFTATTYNATGIVNFALNSSGGTVLCRTVPNDTKLYFYKANTNQSAVIQTQNAGHIIFSITYITDQ